MKQRIREHINKSMRIYSVFHVSLLKKVLSDMSLCIIIKVEHDEDEYEVEKILDVMHKKNNNNYYLVK